MNTGGTCSIDSAPDGSSIGGSAPSTKAAGPGTQVVRSGANAGPTCPASTASTGPVAGGSGAAGSAHGSSNGIAGNAAGRSQTCRLGSAASESSVRAGRHVVVGGNSRPTCSANTAKGGTSGTGGPASVTCPNPVSGTQVVTAFTSGAGHSADTCPASGGISAGGSGNAASGGAATSQVTSTGGQRLPGTGTNSTPTSTADGRSSQSSHIGGPDGTCRHSNVRGGRRRGAGGSVVSNGAVASALLGAAAIASLVHKNGKEVGSKSAEAAKRLCGSGSEGRGSGSGTDAPARSGGRRHGTGSAGKGGGDRSTAGPAGNTGGGRGTASSAGEPAGGIGGSGGTGGRTGTTGSGKTGQSGKTGDDGSGGASGRGNAFPSKTSTAAGSGRKAAARSLPTWRDPEQLAKNQLALVAALIFLCAAIFCMRTGKGRGGFAGVGKRGQGGGEERSSGSPSESEDSEDEDDDEDTNDQILPVHDGGLQPAARKAALRQFYRHYDSAGADSGSSFDSDSDGDTDWSRSSTSTATAATTVSVQFGVASGSGRPGDERITLTMGFPSRV